MEGTAPYAITSERSPFYNLTRAELIELLLSTPYPTVLSLCQGSKAIRAICQEEELWRLKLERDYKINTQAPGKSWKETYIGYASGNFFYVPLTNMGNKRGMIWISGDMTFNQIAAEARKIVPGFFFGVIGFVFSDNRQFAVQRSSSILKDLFIGEPDRWKLITQVEYNSAWPFLIRLTFDNIPVVTYEYWLTDQTYGQLVDDLRMIESRAKSLIREPEGFAGDFDAPYPRSEKVTVMLRNTHIFPAILAEKHWEIPLIRVGI